MSFLWPQLLLLLLVPLGLAGWYLRTFKRNRDAGRQYAGFLSSQQSQPMKRSFFRHLAPALFLAALAILVLALARPVTTVSLPSQRSTIILALDVSGSMNATDVHPSRIKAAKAAVQEFVELQPSSTRIGVVGFATAATLVQSPTENHSDILQAVNGLQLQGGTAIGSAILISLKALLPDLQIDLGTADLEPKAKGSDPQNPTANDPLRVQRTPAPVAPGSYKDAAIILLSDGEANTGPDPVETSRVAAERGVRIYTVGIGTPVGQTLTAGGWSMRVTLDEKVMKQIARNTGGEYLYAATGEQLSDVYKKLSTRLAVETTEMEVGAILVGVAALCAAVAAMMSMLRSNRIF